MVDIKKCTIGIDLGGTKILLLCDAIEEIHSTGPLFTPSDLESLLVAFTTRHHLKPTHLGLAVPGLVNEVGKVVACDVLPAFTDWWPANAETLQSLCAHIAVLNDVKAALLEDLHEAHDVHETPAGLTTGGVVMVGTAIGAGFVVNGVPLRGASGWAGELGYLPVVWGDQVKRLDEVAGGAAIVRQCGVSPALMVQRAADGDVQTLRVIESAGKALGLGLAAVINLLNPSRLAVGGGTVELPGYWAAACLTAQENTIPEIWRDCALVKMKSGRQVVAKGAVRAAMKTN